MYYLKNLLIGLATSVAAYLNPISGDIKSLIALFAVNFLFGLLAGLLVHNESFSFKKAFRCILEAMAFFVEIPAPARPSYRATLRQPRCPRRKTS